MRVFKFYSGELFYAYSGHDETEAQKALFDDLGEMTIDDVEEIPEDEWDYKSIKIWDDNDMSQEPFLVSIREMLIGDMPTMVFTNDLGEL